MHFTNKPAAQQNLTGGSCAWEFITLPICVTFIYSFIWHFYSVNVWVCINALVQNELMNLILHLSRRVMNYNTIYHFITHYKATVVEYGTFTGSLVLHTDGFYFLVSVWCETDSCINMYCRKSNANWLPNNSQLWAVSHTLTHIVV